MITQAQARELFDYRDGYLYLGSFDTQADAKAAYDSIAKEWFGNFYQEPLK